ncbi:MAG: signal recognition particle-docking protein FtsY [Candidatus Thermoplasmatota archaeon]|nr:signal recognition particle-docking protein FtsY [Candidatus Thermoplasmatota archaeon]
MFKFLKDRLKGWREKTAEEAGEIISEEKGRRIREKKLEDVLWDLEISLMEADVAVPVIEEIKESLREDLIGKKVSRTVSFSEGIEVALRAALKDVLVTEELDFERFIEDHEKPVVIMFVGVNGTGKTTAIARVAHLLKGKGMNCVMAASDTFRAGAIEQLEKHAQNLDVRLIRHDFGGDPAAVAFDAVEHARAKRKDVVLIDTAGRMQTNINLMDEMKKIRRVTDPDLVIFVGDALAGNDAVDQAQAFHEAVGIDAAILCKIDADAKGGAALSIAKAIGKPIIYVGTGQEYGDLVRFDPEWMIKRIFED